MNQQDRMRAYQMIRDAYGLKHRQRDRLDGQENLDNILQAAIDGRWDYVRRELMAAGVLPQESETVSSMEVKYPQVMVQLTGQDGNAFNLIGIVARKLRQRIDGAAADAFTVEAMNQGSYDELLAFIQRTVDVR